MRRSVIGLLVAALLSSATQRPPALSLTLARVSGRSAPSWNRPPERWKQPTLLTNLVTILAVAGYLWSGGPQPP